MVRNPLPPRWWLAPLLYTLAGLAGLGVVLAVSATAREVVAKAVMMLAGALATPFILETATALFGLVLVILINQWRLQREGDGWVYLAKTEPDARSVADGADPATRRLEGVILPEKPDAAVDFEGRLAMAEGYLELGLAREALDQLDRLSPAEQALERVRLARAAAEARLA
jgi:uncharacterized membrane protein